MNERTSGWLSEQPNDNGLCGWLHRKTNISLATENCRIHTHKFILIYYKSCAIEYCRILAEREKRTDKIDTFKPPSVYIEIGRNFFILFHSNNFVVNAMNSEEHLAEIITLPFVHLLIYKLNHLSIATTQKKYFFSFCLCTLFHLTSWKLTLLTAHTNSTRVQPLCYTQWHCSFVFHSQ